MPTLTNHKVNQRIITNFINENATSYTAALAETTPDLITTQDNSQVLGFQQVSGYRTQHNFMRLDIRRYIGMKYTAVTWKPNVADVVVTTGSMTLELRSHTRTNRTGEYANGDHQTPAEMAAQTLYASVSGLTTDPFLARYTAVNNGTALIDAINAALETDGIIDFLICSAKQSSNTPPAGTNVESLRIQCNGRNNASGSSYFEMTLDGEKAMFYPATTNTDAYNLIIIDASWSNVLNGVGPVTDSSPESSDAFGAIYNSSFTRYEAGQHFWKLDLSGVDTTRQIRRVLFAMGYCRAPTALLPVDGSELKQIRRYDWTTASTSLWRTQSQLNALTLMAEFESANAIDFDGFDADDPGEDSIFCQYFVEGNQDLVDAVAAAPSNIGFVFTDKRMSTGVAPTVSAGDLVPNASWGASSSNEVGGSLIVEYDDGSQASFGGWI